MTEIINVYAREILDSRGNPTVEAEVTIFSELPDVLPFHPVHRRENTKCSNSVMAIKKGTWAKA